MDNNLSTTPTLTVCGSTGAGKSSLINALTHADIQKIGVTPTTREAEAHRTPLPGNTITVNLMDTPGIGEASNHELYMNKLLDILPHTDLVLWVVGYDNRALDVDIRMLSCIRTDYPEKPILVAGNRMDTGARNFNPKTFNPSEHGTTHEQNVHNWLNYVRETFTRVQPAGVIACASGESGNDTARQYNLLALSDAIGNTLPAAMRARWLELERAGHKKSSKADKIVLAATATAGTIGLVPIPMADMPFIVATQVTMILSLCAVYDRTLSADTAKSLSMAALSAVAGPLLFQAISKLIPGIGSVVGAGVASTCTYAVGKVTQTILESGHDFDLSNFKVAVKNLYKQRKLENKDN